MGRSKTLGVTFFLFILLFGAVPALGGTQIQVSELPVYFPGIQQLKGLGITSPIAAKDALSYSDGRPIPNSYELRGKVASSVPNMGVDLIIAEFDSAEAARAEFVDFANRFSQMYTLYQMRNNTDGLDYLMGVSSDTAYGFLMFGTDTYESNGKSYRINPGVGYLTVHLRGNFLIIVSVSGSWIDVKPGNDPGYTILVCSDDVAEIVASNGGRCDVVDSTKPSGYSKRVVSGDRYSAYLQVIGQRRSIAISEASRVHDSLMKLAFESVDRALTSSGYHVVLLSPRNGAHIKQIINGLFSIPIDAKVKGSGAKDLYAVVTLPDGSSERLSVENGEILGVLHMSDPSVKEGTLTVSLYGKIGSDEKLLTKKSVHVSLVSAEVPGDEIDNDMDGLVDCDDPDIATCDACVLQKKLEWAESLMERHIAYINRMIDADPTMKVVYDGYIEHLRELHEGYKDDPDRMVKEMNAYMEEKVYRNQEVNRYISIFKDDPEKRYQLRQIAEKYRYDPILRRIKMRRFIYENSKSEAEREATMNAILTGILEPPKWLVGGQYGSGGALDWANFVAGNFEKVGDTVKLKGTETVKILRTPVNVFLVAQDARSLMKQAEELKKMNLPENTKVSIIVLDGATKIGKLLDPTGYFGNMADATIGALVNLRKKIEERNQGWFTWNGYVLHETAKPGIYEDYETGRKFKRVSGGWLSKPVFVEVKENG